MKTKLGVPLLMGLALLLLLALAVPAIAASEAVPGSGVEKVTLVHYPAGKMFVKPTAKPTPSLDDDYYKLLRVKWNVPENGVQFTLATASWPDLSVAPAPEAVKAEMQEAFAAWDDATSTELFQDSIASGGVAEPSRDFANTISFGPVSYVGALAVTTYWYDRRKGEILEADIEFSTGYKWGIDPDGENGPLTLGSSTFDVLNVGTHEVGHVVGLADLYRDKYSALTMFGYAAPGETLKRSLAYGDILGVQSLYGY